MGLQGMFSSLCSAMKTSGVKARRERSAIDGDRDRDVFANMVRTQTDSHGQRYRQTQTKTGDGAFCTAIKSSAVEARRDRKRAQRQAILAAQPGAPSGAGPAYLPDGFCWKLHFGHEVSDLQDLVSIPRPELVILMHGRKDKTRRRLFKAIREAEVEWLSSAATFLQFGHLQRVLPARKQWLEDTVRGKLRQLSTDSLKAAHCWPNNSTAAKPAVA
jgi:hypothetical protein